MSEIETQAQLLFILHVSSCLVYQGWPLPSSHKHPSNIASGRLPFTSATSSSSPHIYLPGILLLRLKRQPKTYRKPDNSGPWDTRNGWSSRSAGGSSWRCRCVQPCDGVLRAPCGGLVTWRWRDDGPSRRCCNGCGCRLIAKYTSRHRTCGCWKVIAKALNDDKTVTREAVSIAINELEVKCPQRGI